VVKINILTVDAGPGLNPFRPLPDKNRDETKGDTGAEYKYIKPLYAV
jgi:hypothetical protein